jgi:hypothetical protein
MIKVVHAKWAGDRKVALAFSNGLAGTYDFAGLLANDTVLTKPLRDDEAFRQFFLELGALCWPNGLEFSGESLYRALREEGLLRQSAAVAS